jgi:pyrroline-5-carboxylate reductase
VNVELTTLNSHESSYINHLTHKKAFDNMSLIGFIGAGQMAQAIAAGMAKANSDITFLIATRGSGSADAFAQRIGESRVTVADSNQQVMEQCETVFLAVKPQQLSTALAGLAGSASNNPLIVSVITGVSAEKLTQLTGCQRVIRLMPNTPCLVGAGAIAMSAAPGAEPGDATKIRQYLDATGLVVEVAESLLDAVTGLSGSGPAYVFTFIESLMQGGVLTGLPVAMARQLAIQTVLGAAKMVQETGEHPATLRDRVTSPGGTTIEALKALEEGGFRDAVMSAVRASADRSRELGKG